MPANECTPYKTLADTFTARCSAAVTGKTFVIISGDRTGGGGGGAEGSTTVGVGLSADAENVYKVKVCGAGGKAVGVAGWDGAENAEIKVYAVGHGTILPITAGEAITAGWVVASDAAGKVIKYTEGAGVFPLGIAMTKAANAKDVEVLFF
jgi:hypothetical protein